MLITPGLPLAIQLGFGQDCGCIGGPDGPVLPDKASGLKEDFVSRMASIS